MAYEKDALGQLKAYSSAEDFFVGLGLPFDPAVVSVARLHILKRMGEHLAGDGGWASQSCPPSTHAGQNERPTRNLRTLARSSNHLQEWT
ncbi:MAG: hypothetical protein HOP09_12995 [Hyphomicrobium sp.]|nr:hypothetical protein [Hyphomicrobium sp.]